MLKSAQISEQIYRSCLIQPKVLRPINHIEAAQLSLAFTADAPNVGQAALASLLEAIQGLRQSRFTWAKVKLFYSAFYSVQARLMIRGRFIFYVNNSPFGVEALAGAEITKKKGNSHSAAFAEYKSLLKNDVSLSQEIDGLTPVDWLDNVRNEASYRTAPFLDPAAPKEFKSMEDRVRVNLQAYLKDDDLLFCFDPDHAALAYPIWLLRWLSDDLLARKIEPISVSKHFVDIVAKSKCFVPEMGASFGAFKFHS